MNHVLSTAQTKEVRIGFPPEMMVPAEVIASSPLTVVPDARQDQQVPEDASVVSTTKHNKVEHYIERLQVLPDHQPEEDGAIHYNSSEDEGPPPLEYPSDSSNDEMEATGTDRNEINDRALQVVGLTLNDIPDDVLSLSCNS